ncbi:MAG TPA: hypothetical protein VH761_09580 [Ilumatobacteraceae bacterium]|jgi:hypothetical protein
MTALTIVSRGLGIPLTLLLLATLVWLDVRRVAGRRDPFVLRGAAAIMAGLFVLVVVARFVEFA